MVKALVVEDEADIRHLLIEQLEDKGYQVRKADNGAVALQRVKEEIPDIIFVDILISVMDGMLFVSELRENPETSGIPVVLVTAIDLTGVIPRARELGVKHLLAKPWELESLDLMLNQALIPTDKEWEIPAL
jgi:CheY-like chemotaxis protein